MILHATTEEEPDWYNITKIKISYVEPPCEVFQDEINAVAGTSSLQLSLTVTRGVTEDMVLSYADYVYLA